MILYISYKLDEIWFFCDCCMVLCGGKVIGYVEKFVVEINVGFLWLMFGVELLLFVYCEVVLGVLVFEVMGFDFEK